MRAFLVWSLVMAWDKQSGERLESWEADGAGGGTAETGGAATQPAPLPSTVVPH